MYSDCKCKTTYDFGAEIMDNNRKAHIIVISSKENGRLNAAVAVNLAVELAEGGLKSCVLDTAQNSGGLADFFAERNNKNTSLSAIDFMAEDAQTGEKIPQYDVVVVSSPSGKNDYKSSFFYADTLITILDEKSSLGLLSEPEPSQQNILRPSAYTNFVWEIKKHLAATQKKSLNWAVLPCQNLQMIQKQASFLAEIGKKYGFRTSPAIVPNDDFYALFERGLTLFDLSRPPFDKEMTISELMLKRSCRKFAEFVLNITKTPTIS